MSDYDDLIDEEGIAERWTEQEMVDWIRSLPPEAKNYMLDIAHRARESGFDVHYNCCVHRLRVEEVLNRKPSKGNIIDYVANAARGWAEGKVIADIILGNGIKVRQ